MKKSEEKCILKMRILKVIKKMYIHTNVVYTVKALIKNGGKT